MHNLKILFCILVLTGLISCEFSSKTPQEDRIVKIPVFDVDNAYAHIERQVEFGPRRMNSDAHEKCKLWLTEQLRKNGFIVQVQNFEATAYTKEVLKGSNIHGVYNPNVEERILLCAHYDTRHIADKDTVNVEAPIDGADDGASGVGVLLEIARLIDEAKIPMGVDIVFFDAEDHGSDQRNQDYTWGLGSQHWAKSLKDTDYAYKYGILLDMVGAKGATFRKEGYSLSSARTIVHQIWNLAKQMGKEQFFVDKTINSITDDHKFVIQYAKIPMVDIINVQASGKFGDYHHKHSDNIDVIDKKTLAAVGQVVTAQIFRESNKQNN